MIPNQVSRLLHVLAMLAIVLSVTLHASPGAEAGLWTPDANECAFLRDINAYRKSHGVGPLTLSRSLSMAADNHSRYMGRTDDVDHTLGTVTWAQNILNYGYPEGL